MLRSKRTSSNHPYAHSAITARNRLLRDQTMRHAHQSRLSAAEQYHQILQIVRSFKHHYLAQIIYHSDCQTTVALVKSVTPRRSAHEIRVDAVGNVSVHYRDISSTAHTLLYRVCLALLTALICLSLIAFT